MKVSAREIARGRWQLDNDRHTQPCGCVWLLGHDRMIERRVMWCERHRTAYAVVHVEKRH